jgi:hypothetical protein
MSHHEKGKTGGDMKTDMGKKTEDASKGGSKTTPKK